MRDRVAFITGAKGGLGSFITRRFLETGATVVGASRSISPQDFPGPNFDFTKAVAVNDAVQSVITRFGRLDVLVHLLGGFAGGQSVAETDDATWEQMRDLNVTSGFYVLRATVPHLRKSGKGRIVAVGSLTAVEPHPQLGAYITFKAALAMLVRTVALDIEASPYAGLLSSPDGENSSALRYLLVAKGKHGAENQVAAYAAKSVRLRGMLIYRDDQKMILLSAGSIAALDDTQQNQMAPRDLGGFDLVGEIADSKCYLGNMNPGNGKGHRDCAVSCLSGGIPPVFATNDFNGSPTVLLLTGPNQKPLPKEAFLDRVAQPRRIHGRVVQIGNTLLLEMESSVIASRTFRRPPEQGR